jgi:hypothetical protein
MKERQSFSEASRHNAYDKSLQQLDLHRVTLQEKLEQQTASLIEKER